MINAMATCARLLEGMAPRQRLHGLGHAVWGYAFEPTLEGANSDAAQSVTAVWRTGEPLRIAVPVRSSTAVEVVDLMGRSSRGVVSGKSATVLIGPSTVFVVEHA